jgi:hypothetical protein
MFRNKDAVRRMGCLKWDYYSLRTDMEIHLRLGLTNVRKLSRIYIIYVRNPSVNFKRSVGESGGLNLFAFRLVVGFRENLGFRLYLEN